MGKNCRLSNIAKCTFANLFFAANLFTLLKNIQLEVRRKSCFSLVTIQGLRGFAKKTNSKIRDYYGSGWVVGQGVTLNFFGGKSSQNSPKPERKFWSIVPCVLCLYIHCTLLKVVNYYDLRVLSMSVMGFPKKSLDGVGGWGELHPSLFWICWNFCNFAKPLKDTDPVTKLFFYKIQYWWSHYRDLIAKWSKCRRINDPIMNFFWSRAVFLFEVKVYRKM